MMPTDNTYDFIISESSRIMIKTAIHAITELELWDYLRNFSEECFMFTNDERVNKIYKKIEELGYEGHSGGSFSYTMRLMEFIAKNSFEDFKENWIVNQSNRSESPTSISETV